MDNSEASIDGFQTSRSAAITEDYYFMKVINRRIGDMTSSSSNSEILQLIDYDIGGNYEPRVEFHTNTSNISDSRTATVMIYVC